MLQGFSPTTVYLPRCVGMIQVRDEFGVNLNWGLLYCNFCFAISRVSAGAIASRPQALELRA